MTGYHYLVIAILCEISGTIALKFTNGFQYLWPSVFTFVAYMASFYCLAMALRAVPVGMAYAIWSGIGLVGIGVFGALYLREIPSLAALAGMGLILIGVVVLSLSAGDSLSVEVTSEATGQTDIKPPTDTGHST